MRRCLIRFVGRLLDALAWWWIVGSERRRIARDVGVIRHPSTDTRTHAVRGR